MPEGRINVPSRLRVGNLTKTVLSGTRDAEPEVAYGYDHWAYSPWGTEDRAATMF